MLEGAFAGSSVSRGRAATSPLFSPALVIWGLLQGAIAFIPLGALYVLALERGLPETDARSLTFVSLVLVDLGLVLVNRSFATSLAELIGKTNRALVWVAAVTLALLALVILSPVGRELFRFGPLHPDDLMLVVAIVVAVFATLEFLKRFWRARLIT